MELFIEKQEDKLEVIGRVYSSTMAEITEFRTITARLLFWVSGASLAIVGWVVRESDSFDKYEKYLLCASVTTFLLVAASITYRLEKYFLQVAAVINRIDRVHLAYEKGAFLKDDTLFPKGWKQFGSTGWKEPIFKTAYIMLALMCFVCVVTILSV